MPAPPYKPPLLIALAAGMCAACACQRPPAVDAGGQAPAVTAETARRPGEPGIRVMILQQVPHFLLAVDGPFEVLVGDNAVLRGPSLPEVDVHSGAGPAPRISLGTVACPPGEVSIRPARAGSLRLRAQTPRGPGPAHRYDGQLLIRASSARQASAGSGAAGAGDLEVINNAGLESYLVGVLSGELYANFHIETFRAQAIAARTYALYQMQTIGRRNPYDVLATEGSQVYAGLDGIDRRSNAWQAVTHTRGLVLTWSSPVGEKIFCTYYSSACGGMTQNVADFLGGPMIPALRGQVPCDYCRIGGTAYRWGPVVLSKPDIRNRLAEHFGDNVIPNPVTSIAVQQRTADGRPLTLRIAGPDRAAEVNSYAFRLAVGGHTLRSNYFDIVDQGADFAFTGGRGFGHAVGMCQWGAEGQARLGRSASQILAHYYPSSHITRAY